MLARIGAALAVAVLTMWSTAAAAGTRADLNEQDRTYLVRAHQSNLAEIAAGKAASQKSNAAELRDMGAKLIDDHTKLDEDVKRVAQRAGVALPATPSQEQQRQLQEVSGKSGVEFERAWVTSQLAGHRQTLAEGGRELEQGSAAEVKRLARDAEPVVQHHLDMLLDLKTKVRAMAGAAEPRAAARDAGAGAWPVAIGVGILLVAGTALAWCRGRAAR
ncbi:DUF4142 domain-containing protein [Bailinhaonella thermotolerans]|nr:DUF4142 domain-containing protein [Bailinhaonella thermotolerans]